MAIFSEDYIKKYNNKNIETLNEGKVENLYERSKSAIILFYQHMCKWIEKPSFQTSSWVNTIINNFRWSIDKLYDRSQKQINTNALNKIKNDLQNIYYEAMTETLFIKDNKDISKTTKTYELFNNINKINNETLVREILYKYAKDEKAIEWINNKE